MKFAGLDLSYIDLRGGVSQRDVNVIYDAFKGNYEKGYGAIDRSDVDALILNLNKYLKIHFVGIKLKPFGYPPHYNRISKDSLQMALAVYMLPQEGSVDKEMLPYVQALNTFSNIARIDQIRAMPFSANTLHALWQELKSEKSKLNITGFWDKSSNFIFNKVSLYLLRNAYLKLKAVNNKDNSPIAISLKIVHMIDLFNYLNDKMKDVDYRRLMDKSYEDGKNLRDLHAKIKYSLGLNLHKLQAISDKPVQTLGKSCVTMLFNVKRLMPRGLGVPALPKQARRVSPY